MVYLGFIHGVFAPELCIKWSYEVHNLHIYCINQKPLNKFFKGFLSLLENKYFVYTVHSVYSIHLWSSSASNGSDLLFLCLEDHFIPNNLQFFDKSWPFGLINALSGSIFWRCINWTCPLRIGENSHRWKDLKKAIRQQVGWTLEQWWQRFKTLTSARAANHLRLPSIFRMTVTSDCCLRDMTLGEGDTCADGYSWINTVLVPVPLFNSLDNSIKYRYIVISPCFTH